MEGNGEGESSPPDKLKANRKMKSRHRSHSNHFAVLDIMKYLVIHQSRYSQLSITSAFALVVDVERKEERKRIKRVNQTPTHTSRTKAVNQVHLITLEKESRTKPQKMNSQSPQSPNHPLPIPIPIPHNPQ